MIRNTLALALLSSPALAHVPVLSIDAKTDQSPYLIEDPEHSTAIYAILDGDADYYRIDEDEPFDFYVGITAAKLEGCDLQATFSFEVLNAKMEVIDSRDGASSDWWAWYEKFGKQWYWVGPVSARILLQRQFTQRGHTSSECSTPTTRASTFWLWEMTKGLDLKRS